MRNAGTDVDVRGVLVEATNAILPYGLSPRDLGDRADIARRAVRIARPLVRGVLAEPDTQGVQP
jgi:hypothetical protein